jgi:hypothetical protein
MNAIEKRSIRNQEVISQVNNFFKFLEATFYINAKKSEEAGHNHNPKGYSRFHSLSNSSYNQNKKFFRPAYDIQHILNRFEDGYYLSEDQKKEVAIYFDCESIPDLMVQDLLSLKFHSDKNLYTFRHTNPEDKDDKSYIGINFNP